MTADLEVLRRTDAAPDAAPSRIGRVFVGIVVVLGAVALAGFLFHDAIFPPRPVRTAAIVAEAAGTATRASAFDATGWVEPDPFPTQVRPLVDGVVERFDVVEGDVVVAGTTVLARVRNVDLEADVERLTATLAHTKAHLPEVAVDLAEAKRLLELRLSLRAETARLEGDAAVATAEQAAATAEVEVARRRLAVAQTEATAQDTLEHGGGGLPVARARAEAAVAAAQAEVAAKQAAVLRADAAVESARRQLAVAKDALDHPVELEARIARTEAHWKAAQAEIAAGEAELAIAQRKVALLEVRSPVDGVVLLRRAAPGTAVGPGVAMRRGEGSGATADGALIDLYDPKRLQVRVNVQLQNVSLVGRDRAVELTLDAIPGKTFHGVVVRLTSLADRANNTLEAKVRITDPDPVMKPEMVVRARFLVPEGATPVTAGAQGRVTVPKAAVRGEAVFVVDPRRGGRARRVPVMVMGEEGDRVEVHGDLSVTQRAILDVVEDGDRVVDGGGP